jgi:signal peptidase I
MPETAASLAPPPPPSNSTTATAAPLPDAPRNNIKETLISLTIAFALAFVFRGFVVEAFLIPTGSMAPTLNGAHARFSNPKTGLDWAVGPRMEDMLTPDVPRPVMGTTKAYPIIDPITRQHLGAAKGARTRAGDRIFVMKYLYSIFDPARYDIVVFKNPTEPQVNFIKRLLGLPGDQLALIDGDVWVRTPKPDDLPNLNAWQQHGWKVAAKPELAQRSMWQTVFDSQYTPIGTVDGVAYQNKWIVPSETLSMWDMQGKQDYRFAPKDGVTQTRLDWDYSTSIRDYYAYNEDGQSSHDRFPVGDIALSYGVRPDNAGLDCGLVVLAYRHEFKAEFKGNTVALKMRPQASSPAKPGDQAEVAEWKTLATANLAEPLKPGVVTDLEFWHVDQTLQAFVNGKPVAFAEYDWSPHERIVNATTLGPEWAAAVEGDPTLLASTGHYVSSGARLEFEGGPFTLSRVTLKRDIFYQPSTYPLEARPRPHSRGGHPALATAPQSVLTLGPDEFFCCGDNSPASLDGRLWDAPDPWVGAIDPKMGVVHRNLLIGKAFFVYFPAPSWRGMIPIPDFGRMRFIW